MSLENRSLFYKSLSIEIFHVLRAVAVILGLTGLVTDANHVQFMPCDIAIHIQPGLRGRRKRLLGDSMAAGCFPVNERVFHQAQRVAVLLQTGLVLPFRGNFVKGI